MKTSACDLITFLQTLENVFDLYCDQIAEQQGAMLLARRRHSGKLQQQRERRSAGGRAHRAAASQFAEPLHQ